MKRVLTLILIFVSISVFASSGDKIFLDANFNPVPGMTGAKYYRIVSLNEHNTYFAEVFYLTDSPQMKGHYLDADLTILHGLCSYFYRNGRVESQGLYDHGKRIGKWERYTLFGEKKNDRYYPTKSELNAKDDVKTCLAKFDDSGKNLNSFLKSNLVFPQQAELLDLKEGYVNVNLFIDEKGNITSFEMLSSTSRAFTLEAERVIKFMPQWSPAFNNGNAVSSNYIIKMQFNEETCRVESTTADQQEN